MKLIDAFKNGKTRPRAIIWTGTLLVGLMLFIPIMVGATTSYWFCAAICHYPQADTISSYNRSTHSNVACTACHMPLGADPITFLIHKVEALAELPPTIAGTVVMPINPTSHLAMYPKHMSKVVCVQCHNLENREVTPSEGIIISHEAHDRRGIGCTVCHNRVAHDESDPWQPELDATDGNNPKHDVFMTMTSCYRCHRLEDDGQEVTTPYAKATGECAACHPESFDLVPASHKVEHFVKDHHGEMAVEEAEKVEHAKEHASEEHPLYVELDHYEDEESQAINGVPSVRAINECYTCHKSEFCTDCHGGVEMPHPAGYVKTHKEEATEYPEACEKCHATSGQGGCTTCHHSDPNVPGWEFDPNELWLPPQHAKAAQEVGANSCFNCHVPTSCSKCHVGLSR